MGMKFYAGALDLGQRPQWDHVAAVLNLLVAHGVELAPGRATAGKRALLPFLVKESSLNLAFLGSSSDDDMRKNISSLCKYPLVKFVRIDPRKADDSLINEMVRLVKKDGERLIAASDIKPAASSRALADPLEAFDGLLGLDEQKLLLRKIGTLVSKHGRGAVDSLHMAYLGPAGTGKTELAKRMGVYFDALGITSGRGVFVKATAADLIGRYVGHTPHKVYDAVERARGGVLFIDEAYGLMNSSSFGQEAIDCLVDALEEHRDDMVCIVAGYEDDIERLFASNSGLRDRFAFRVRFSGYTPEQLAELFELFAGKRGFAVEEGARAALGSCVEALRKNEGFANARTMRRFCDRAVQEAAFAHEGACINADDLRAAFAQPDIGGDKKHATLGFV